MISERSSTSKAVKRTSQVFTPPLTRPKAGFLSLVNSAFKKFGKPNPFEISTMERISSTSMLGFPNQQINALQRWWHVGFKETLIGSSVVVFLACVIVAVIWGAIKGWPELGDLLVEFWGLIFDVLVILVGYGVIQHRKQRGMTLHVMRR